MVLPSMKRIIVCLVPLEVRHKFGFLDSNTGKIVTSLPCAANNNHMMFDAKRKRIYITGTDTTTVIEQHDADHYEQLAEVPTGHRSKTSILVPELNRIYVALSGKDMSGKPLLKPGVQMAIKIYEVQP